jgi:hypothetical protein
MAERYLKPNMSRGGRVLCSEWGDGLAPLRPNLLSVPREIIIHSCESVRVFGGSRSVCRVPSLRPDSQARTCLSSKSFDTNHIEYL